MINRNFKYYLFSNKIKYQTSIHLNINKYEIHLDHIVQINKLL